MKILKTLWLIPVLGLLPVMPSLAHGDVSQDRLERRIERQHMRIKQGVNNGELTRREAKRLRKEHRRIKHLKRNYLSDGRLNHRERHSLENKLDRASKHIYRMKHNDNYKYFRRGWYGDRYAHGGRSYLYKGKELTIYYDSRSRW